MPRQLTYGDVPVPYTVSWTGEECNVRVSACEHASRRPALCQAEARGAGKPLFGKPHMQRQREVIAGDLCDLCGRSLKGCTKVSLSHARPRSNGATGMDILQVEPLLHKECAATSIRHCPALRRDVENETLQVRQVTRHRVQFAIMDEVYTQKLTGCSVKAIGHAKVELLRWKDRNAAWLTRSG